MKKKKYISIVAAALLAVAPVASVPFVAQGQATVVKAASTATSDQLMAAYYAKGEERASNEDATFVELTKKTPYITVKAGTTVKQVKNQRVTDIETNHGSLAGITNFQVYNAFDNGSPDLNSQLGNSTKLQVGRNYTAAIQFKIGGLPFNVLYTGAYLHKNNSDIFVGNGGDPTLLVPIRVTATSTSASTSKPATTTTTKKVSTIKKSSTIKISKHGYVTVRKGYKVKTYTSTGKFSKHYVYRHHTYKLNRKKYIKGHGTCYKIYGKNQWIPGKYLKLKK